ncbi:uncharacterized protein LOC129569971 isoform X2 [Sitodiplosis mosellana]|uniref:uncharacterized protein LOC129569971 isoform X2 n=1 Tax=Sitodiplosis mosellana TaxID=263140 RepID=UPI0024448E10|nr:uncharacterized protein LOC129569971 isoform X2 [Sitodiplosis mosellana]
MGENIHKQLNDYLKNVDTVVRDALERFDTLYSSYGETNSDFINDIKEITINSVNQACKRFEIESKLKKAKDFPMGSATTYANTLKNNATELENGHGNMEHERNEIQQALSASSSLTEIDALDPSDELKGQKTLLNSLHISGIPIDAIKTEDAQIAVLQKMCKKANVSYNKDVDQFYVKNNALIVKFHRFESKDKIRNYAENKDLWTNELLDLNKGQDPSKIKVRCVTT